MGKKLNELRSVVSREQADEWMKNYKTGDPVPQEMQDYGLALAEQRAKDGEVATTELKHLLGITFRK